MNYQIIFWSIFAFFTLICIFIVVTDLTVCILNEKIDRAIYNILTYSIFYLIFVLQVR